PGAGVAGAATWEGADGRDRGVYSVVDEVRRNEHGQSSTTKAGDKDNKLSNPCEQLTWFAMTSPMTSGCERYSRLVAILATTFNFRCSSATSIHRRRLSWKLL